MTVGTLHVTNLKTARSVPEPPRIFWEGRGGGRSHGSLSAGMGVTGSSDVGVGVRKGRVSFGPPAGKLRPASMLRGSQRGKNVQDAKEHVWQSKRLPLEEMVDLGPINDWKGEGPLARSPKFASPTTRLMLRK